MKNQTLNDINSELIKKIMHIIVTISSLVSCKPPAVLMVSLFVMVSSKTLRDLYER